MIIGSTKAVALWHVMILAVLQVKIRCWSCGVKKQGKCGELFAGKAISAAAAAGAAAQAALQVCCCAIPMTEISAVS